MLRLDPQRLRTGPLQVLLDGLRISQRQLLARYRCRNPSQRPKEVKVGTMPGNLNPLRPPRRNLHLQLAKHLVDLQVPNKQREISKSRREASLIRQQKTLMPLPSPRLEQTVLVENPIRSTHSKYICFHIPIEGEAHSRRPQYLP
jgi:hypothetical protein